MPADMRFSQPDSEDYHFWDEMLRSLVLICRHFGEARCHAFMVEDKYEIECSSTRYFIPQYPVSPTRKW